MPTPRADNALKSGKLPALAKLHEDLDRAVLDAYGWSDLHVPPYHCTDRKWELEVINRLYQLNLVRSSP